MTSAVDWTGQLHDQLDFHYRHHVRPRLEGLTDEEYLWEPVPGSWSIRPRAETLGNASAGGGDLVIDYATPEPAPAPVTTIAWRLGHLVVSCLALRVAGHFGGPEVDHATWQYAATADEALAQLDEQYAAWSAGETALDEEALARPCGETEGPFAAYPLAALVLHINREVIHLGAEICLLRDLYVRSDDHEESA